MSILFTLIFLAFNKVPEKELTEWLKWWKCNFNSGPSGPPFSDLSAHHTVAVWINGRDTFLTSLWGEMKEMMYVKR